jgi:CRP-like cAMP-binding protein
MTSPPISGAAVDIKAGTVIFQEGDPGGDLYFIREGEVDVFKAKEGVEVTLATLKPGEVLGIMTCLTREPRLASARARTDVKALIVKQAGIKTLITSTPPWVQTVIKDFIVRIKNINTLYWDAVAGREDDARDLASLELAIAVANGLGEIGSLAIGTQVAVREDAGAKLVDIDDVIARLARVLEHPRERVQAVFQTLVDTGWLRVESGAPVKKAELGVLARLSSFGAFARRYVDNSIVRSGYASLSSEEIHVLAAIAERAKTLAQGKTQHDVWLPLEKLVVEPYTEDATKRALDKAIAVGLMRMEPVGDDSLVVLSPALVSTSVRAWLTVQRLLSVPRAERATPSIAALTESY